MERRRFLQVAGASTLVAGAGCAGLSADEDIQDTDGDGVIDSEDYAPRDPDVQERSDIQDTDTITPTPSDGDATEQTPTASSTPTPTPTPSPTPTPTPTPTPSPTPTPTPTPTSTPNANQLVVEDTYWEGGTHITSYSSRDLSAVITEDYPETDYDSAKLLVQRYEFPRERVIDEELTDEFDRTTGPHEVTIEFDAGEVDEGIEYNYLIGLVPGDTTLDSIDYSNVTTAMETDPFVLTDGRTITRTEYDGQLDDDSGDSYSRNSVEGAYQLEIRGRTRGSDWTVQFFGYKSAHAAAVNRSRGRSRSEYVAYELTDGTAVELATLLKNEANAREFSDAEAVGFVIDFVQALPYVPDDVSRGFDDYTKFIMETMPEMGGDCEDTAIMLAAILEADPFGYDMILIQPPGHMAVGIWQSEPDGWYWELEGRKYSYIETTGQGWGVGDCPEQYQGADAYLYQV